MSEESTPQNRKPTPAERNLLMLLITKASDLRIPAESLEAIEVKPMADGKMGSLRLFFPQTSGAKQFFGRRVSELVFNDADGVRVIASLNLDMSGFPMELDLWKTDFSPLIRIPADLGGL